MYAHGSLPVCALKYTPVQMENKCRQPKWKHRTTYMHLYHAALQWC